MIELSSSSSPSSSAYASMGLVPSPPRTVCSSPNTTKSLAIPRLTKYSCQEIEKLKHKYRLQQTDCLTHWQRLLQSYRVDILSYLRRSTEQINDHVVINRYLDPQMS
jgi:hypothetical protein